MRRQAEHLVLSHEWKAAREEQARCVWALHPSSSPRACIDLTSVLVLMYDMIMIPVILAWNLQGTIFTMLAYCTSLFWTLDILLSCFTGYYEGGELEMRPARIARHYLRTWFPLDGAVIVIDWMGVLVQVTGAAPNLGILELSVRMLKLSRILRILSLLRMFQLSYRFENLVD
eukprot:3959880-Amphidinium_carterae.1